MYAQGACACMRGKQRNICVGMYVRVPAGVKALLRNIQRKSCNGPASASPTPYMAYTSTRTYMSAEAAEGANIRVAQTNDI